MSDVDMEILVIDDEQHYRESIRQTLSEAGLPCRVASSMGEARERAGVSPPALVLLDLGLPSSDGLESLAEWLLGANAPKVIVLSDVSAQGEVLEALRRGASDYLAKPLHEEELCLAVRRNLEAWAVARNLRNLETQLETLAIRSESLHRESEATPVADEFIRQGVVDLACDVLKAQRASLLLLDTAGKHLVVVARSGTLSSREGMEPIPCGEGVSGFVFSRAKPMWVEDMETHTDLAILSNPGRYRSKSFVAVPIFHAESLLGLLFVSEPTGRKAFAKGDLSLLRWAAQPLAENLRLSSAQGRNGGGLDKDGSRFRESLREASPALNAEVLSKPDSDGEMELESEMAREICQAVADEIDPARVIGVALGRVAALLPAAPVSLYLADSVSGELRCEATLDGGVCEDRPDLELRRGLTGVAIQTGQLVASEDPSSDPRFDVEVDTPMGGKAQPMMCLPLRLRGKSVGLFRAFLPEGEPVSPRTAEVLSAALSAALRSVLLYRSLVESIEEVAEARKDRRS